MIVCVLEGSTAKFFNSYPYHGPLATCSPWRITRGRHVVFGFESCNFDLKCVRKVASLFQSSRVSAIGLSWWSGRWLRTELPESWSQHEAWIVWTAPPAQPRTLKIDGIPELKCLPPVPNPLKFMKTVVLLGSWLKFDRFTSTVYLTSIELCVVVFNISNIWENWWESMRIVIICRNGLR